MIRRIFFWMAPGCVLGLFLAGCAERPDSLSSVSNPAGETIAPTGTVDEVEKVKAVAEPVGPAPEGMVWIPAGRFEMGCDLANGGKPDEMPVHTVELDGYYIDKTEVTNAQFQKFVDATGYVTMAERRPKLRSMKRDAPKIEIPSVGKFSKPGSICLNPELKVGDFDPLTGAYSWSDYITGADWRHPEGPESSIKDRMDHPVVHVAWLDAQAYCDWAGKKLPTEAQWEYAARGGIPQQIYPWGDTRNPEGKWLHNIWQGDFPVENTVEDGYRGTAPVGSFPPNRFGLYDTSGNVWEWVADYYRPDYYERSPKRNPSGPESSFDPQDPDVIKRVQRGGSFMCADSYCISYRNAARMKGEEDTGTFHAGFRCVVTPEILQKRGESSLR